MTTAVSTETSRATVQAMYDAALQGDVEGMLSHLAQDVVVREAAFLPYGGDYHGHQGFLTLLGKVGKVLDITGIQIDYVVADNDKVIAMLRVPDLTTRQSVLLAEESTVREGKIIEMRIFCHDAQSLTGATKL